MTLKTMITKILFVILLFSTLLLIFSCDGDKNILRSADELTPLEILRNTIHFSMVDYDSLLIQNNPNSTLPEKLVAAIEFGEKTTGEFIPKQSVKPTYSENPDGYTIHFSLSEQDYTMYLRAYYFTIRFLLQDSTNVDVDTLALTYKFPYESVEIFLKTPEKLQAVVQDFEIIDNTLYFITLREGLYKYDFTTKDLEQLYNSKNNFYLARNSEYLFMVNGWHRVYRYNVQVDSVDRVFDILPPEEPHIQGIDVYNGRFYLLIDDLNFDQTDKLAIYDLEGELIENIPFANKDNMNCLVYNDILYTVDFDKELSKFDLITREFLPSSPLPSLSTKGMSEFGGNFYFLDDARQIIAVLPLSELE